jgi:hypothetical protein
MAIYTAKSLSLSRKKNEIEMCVRVCVSFVLFLFCSVCSKEKPTGRKCMTERGPEPVAVGLLRVFWLSGQLRFPLPIGARRIVGR